ncbi:MAG: class D beta-lactamase [Chlorobiaceae bacterium]|nr:class D beta-lactamase [Chlorobiaceae bacterium]
MRIFAFLIFLHSISFAAYAEDRELDSLFTASGIDGSMVISSLKTGKLFIGDEKRAGRKVSPASTFKIFNTLIALRERAVTENDNLLKWDGHKYDFPDWNRDQTLESAFRVSCVWYYQELARRIGEEKYRRYLKDAGYGELREPFDAVSFWLDGSLLISPFGQVDFLKKVYERKLPFSKEAYDKLAKIMVSESGPGYTIRAKTGWAGRMEPQAGWFVGYVETENEVSFFALVIDIRSESDLPLRKGLAIEALKLKGIIR